MTDSQRFRTAHPQRFWPARPADLVDTSLCPSCFRPLSGPVCGFCGLDARTPLAARVLELGRAMVATEAERQAVMGEIRREALERAALASQIITPPSAFRYPPAAAVPTTHPSAAAASSSSGPFPPPGPPSSATMIERRRSTGQILLLTAGVVLVSVFAIFFAVLAYLFATVEFRSVLTGIASLLVLGVAWALRSRRLAGTAEAIAVIGVVLLLLDVWIIRVNRLFSVDRVDVWLYTGLALVILSALLIGITRVTGLRAASVSAAVIAPIGAFALGVGASASLGDGATRVLLGAVPATLVVVIEVVVGIPRIERAIVRVGSLLFGLVAVTVAGVSFPSLGTGVVLGFALSVVVWSVVLVVTHRSASILQGTAWRVLSGIGLALAMGGLAVAASDHLSSNPSIDDAWRPVLLAAAALFALTIARVVTVPAQRTLRLVSAITASFAALVMLVPVSLILSRLVGALSSPWFRSSPLDALVRESDGLVPSAAGLAATALVSALLIWSVGAGRSLAVWGWAPAVVLAVATVGGGLAVPGALASVAILLLAAIVALLGSVWKRTGIALRATAFACSVAFALLASALATATSALWLGTTLIALVILSCARVLVGRRRVPGPTASAVFVSTAATIAALSIGLVAPAWGRTLGVVWPPVPDGFGVAVAAAGVLVALVLVVRHLTVVEAITVACLAAVALVVSWGVVWLLQSGLADVGWRLGIAIPVLVAAVCWSGRRQIVPVRVVAASIIVPTTTLVAAEMTLAVDRGTTPGLEIVAAPTALGLVVAIGVLREFRVERSRAVAIAVDLGTVVPATAILVLSAGLDAPIGPLALLVLAVTPVLVAFRPIDGHTPRRQLAWIGAVLATAALWWFLADRSVETIEWYSLPVAGLLLIVGSVSAISRARSSERETAPVGRLTGTDIVVGAAAAIAVLPSALQAGSGSIVRVVALITIGVALMALSTFSLRDWATLHGRAIGWFTAIAAIGVPVISRTLGPDGARAGTEVLWVLAAATAAFLLAAIAVSIIRPSATLANAAAASSSVVIVVAASGLIGRGQLDGVGGLPWLLIVCVTAVVATTRSASSSIVTAIASTVGAIVLGTTMLADVPHVEYISVPLAFAAITAGSIRLARNPAARSWPMLGPGLILLIAPSLGYDVGETTLWRIIAVGVVAVGILLVGILRRLQAPIVIGALTAITHGLAQLWPWISGLYEAGYWWLWAGICGVILIVFAARYEQRMKNIRDARSALITLR